MATVANDPGGYKRVVVTIDGKRKPFRLGRVCLDTADEFARCADRLAMCRSFGETPDPRTRSWLEGLSDEVHAKLANVGLVDQRENLHLGPWLDKYLGGRKIKPSSLRKLKQTQTKLVKFFGEKLPIRKLNPNVASDWETWLKTTASSRTKRSLSQAAVRIHCGNAKEFFADAVRRKLLPESPFDHLSSGSTPRAVDRYVSLAELGKVLAVCPDSEWKLWFALAFFAMLRVPSETQTLTWADVDFSAARLNVRSPKTERHAGHEGRTVAIAPPLAEILQAQFDAAPAGSVKILRRSDSGYIDEKAVALIRASGVTPWPALFTTLRASGERYWQGQGVDVEHAAKLAGHSVSVSQRHYVRSVPDEVLDRMAGKAARNAAQQRKERPSISGQPYVSGKSENGTSGLQAATCGNEGNAAEMGDEGLEPPTSRV
jgi:integrase